MSSILHRIQGQTRDIGFPVKRLLPAMAARMVGPFVFFDHMGPMVFAEQGTEGDVRPHPHIGLATVTYLFSGALMHRDSLGSVQRITPGDVNWMSAGCGIVHSERIPEDIRTQHVPVQGIQMWIGLPLAEEESAPGFWHYPAADLPRVATVGVTVHVLAGQAFGQQSPVKTNSPTLYAAINMEADAQIDIAKDYAERALYVVDGAISVDGEVVEAGTLVVLRTDIIVNVIAQNASRLMLLGGAPLDGGARFVWWNFVASSKEKIEAAKLAWATQEHTFFPPVPGESEFIPLPESKL
ncbi:pirin family protein [Glaciimonas soli]|uniref:Pirin family protein n=1 Tax=Glaciimonas soli TaxID=2590999 RepID=A0A843YVE4_9BURK|nr:pirin family protein [Glaciimonas soli]MQR01663.1 pirin family protein [Glaciimonas soli]